jgi:hypothetical protein
MSSSDRVKDYINTSFGRPRKSHSGCAVRLENTVTTEVCGKQKIVTKISTEAELVLLSYHMVEIEQMDEVVRRDREEMGLMLLDKAPIIYQGNDSTISSVTYCDR